MPLFYTVGIFDEGAYYTIGNNFGAILFVLIGAFDDVLVYLYFNELFLKKTDMLHISQRWFFSRLPGQRCTQGCRRTGVLRASCMRLASDRTCGVRSHTRGLIAQHA